MVCGSICKTVDTPKSLRHWNRVHCRSYFSISQDHRKFSHLELFKVAQIVIFWFGRILPWVQMHRVKTCPTYTNQISLTSVMVTAAIDLFNGNQWVHLNRHMVLRLLGPGVPYDTCGHLRWILLGKHRIKSLHLYFWSLNILQIDQFDLCQGHSS